ncbi:MAG: hypothetical protein P8M73_11810 [Luminiphilus sp.]|nr:hypothetical protein [Luminiphilus sp.]
MKMILGRAVVWVVLLGALLSGTASAQDFQGLRESMTPKELKAAGLDNLSPEQQQFLDGWLRQRFMSPSTSGAVGQTVTNDSASGNINQGSRSIAAGDNEAVGKGAIGKGAIGNQAIEAEIERRVAIEVNAAIAKATEEDAVEEAAREAARDKPFEAEIVGPFSGWSGKTVFTLSNGQVWRQRSGSDYRHTAEGQTVAVKKNFVGYWTLTVLSSGRTVGVRRID